jgi:hypothetical protein
MYNKWIIKQVLSGMPTKHEGKTIELLTLEDLDILKREVPDRILIDIFGNEVKVREADRDTRAGFVAYGVLV